MSKYSKAKSGDKILEVATKLEKASKAHAGQAKALRSMVKSTMFNKRKAVK